MDRSSASPAPPDLAHINAMDRAAFICALGSAFEHAPWVADRAWGARPFDSVDSLHAAMLGVVRQEPLASQVAFLCGHPELAGREARAGALTGDSEREQASAGLDAMSAQELAEMARLNADYRSRHGFPFIIAVRRHTKAQIFSEMRRRIGEETPAEFAAAMAQIASITRLRVQALVGAGSASPCSPG